MNIIIADDPDSVSRIVAERFVKLVENSSGRFRWVLAGGSTPRLLYRLLAREPYRSRTDWSRVDFFWGDERCVSPDHSDSNYKMACGELLNELDVPQNQVFRMEADRTDLDVAAQEYGQMVESTFCGVGPLFDLVLLGMGADGHTASLFPATDALGATGVWAVSNDIPQMNTRRITLTAEAINRSRHVWFLVCGDDKKERLVEVLEGERDTNRLPSQLIHPSDGELVWFLDEAAAVQLQAPK